MLSLLTLGRLELVEDGVPLLPRRRKELALLAYLARRAPRVVSRNELAALLWGERGEGRAKQSLRQALSELRQALGDRLEISAETVRLAEDGITLDARQFEAAVRAEQPEQAVALWQGDFLAGTEDLGEDGFRTWLEQERAGLRKQLAWAQEQLVAAAQAGGDWKAAIRHATAWTETLPYDEKAQRRLVDALRLAGRPAEAAAAHAAFTRRLRDELGRAPSEEFLRLGEALEPAAAPARLGARGLLTPDLTGRDEALQQLTAAWQRVRQGGAAVVLVLGDEGLGKSRLCREFAGMVRGRGEPATIVEGRGFEAERERPWATLRPMLGALSGAPGLLAAPPVALAAIAEIAPEIRERHRQIPAAGAAGAPVESLLRVLAEIAAETPLLFILDDATSADGQSLEAVGALIRRPPAHTLVVLAARAEALTASPLGPELQRAAAQLVRLELPPLSLPQVELLASSMMPLLPEATRALGDAVLRETAGNPGQAEQLIGFWADTGVLAPGADGRWRFTREPGAEPLPLPAGVREASLGRLQQLSADARRVIEAAAALEIDVDPELLEQVSGLSGERFAAAIGELLSRRMLRESRRRAGAQEFASGALRRAVYESIAPSRRRALRGSRARFGPRWRAVAVAGIALLGLGGWLLLRSRAPEVSGGAQVLLADVENSSGDPTLGRAIHAAATVALQGSRRVSLFPRSRVRETLARMGRPAGDTVLSETLAREVARREGIAAVVVLSLARVDSSYLLGARFFDPVSGRDLYDAGRTVQGRAGLLPGLDGLLHDTRRALGESRAELRTQREPLPQVTTSSLEALLAYTEGNEAWTRRDYVLAAERWHRAIELDSSFALAMAAMADYYYFQANDRVEGARLLTRALAQVGRLTERERLRIEAQAAARQGRDVEAVDLWRGLAERYPSRDAWFNLATTLLGQYRCREAIPAARRALAFDSLFTNAHINLATCLQLTGQAEASLAEYAAAERGDSMALLRSNINHEWGAVFVRLDRLRDAEAAYRRMLEVGNPLDRARGHRSLAWLEMLQGRVHEAVSHLLEAISLNQTAGSTVSLFRNRVILADAYLLLGQARQARGQLAAAELLRKEIVDPVFLLYFGRAALRAQRLDLAEAALQQSVAAGPLTTDAERNAREGLEGAVRLARGDAVGAAEVARPDHGERIVAFRLAVLAEAFAAMGQRDSALAVAVRLSNTWSFGEEAQIEWQRGPLLVARYAEAKGDSATARAAYSRFIEQWKDGDQDLPELGFAKRALGRLQAGAKR